MSSLWKIDFPAAQEDFDLLTDHAMSVDEATVMFHEAADDFIGTLFIDDQTDVTCPLLTVFEYDKRTDSDSVVTVLLRTSFVEPISARNFPSESLSFNAIKLGRRLCDAILYVHNNQLPKRLLTLDNIFVDVNGDFYLGNFGSTLDERFLSPEEHRGEDTMYNAEVCSIGVLLYTVLNDFRIPLLSKTVLKPSDEDIADAVQARHSGVPLPPPVHAGRVLTQIILKACAYKPKARFSSVHEFSEVLAALCSQGTSEQLTENDAAKQSHKDWTVIKKILSVAVTAIIVIIVSSVLISLLTPDSPTLPVQKPSVPKPSQSQITNIYIDSVLPVTDAIQTTGLQEDSEDNVTEITDAVNLGLFKQISLYHSAHYLLIGTLEQDGTEKPTEFAITDSSLYMTSDIDGSVIAVLKDAEGKVHLVDPKQKCSLELNKTLLKLLGMNADELDNIASLSVTAITTESPQEMKEVSYRGQQLTSCAYALASGKREVFYVNAEGDILYIETYTADNILDSTMVVSSLTAEVPDQYIRVPSDYTKYSGMTGMFSFVSGLNPEQ